MGVDEVVIDFAFSLLIATSQQPLNLWPMTVKLEMQLLLAEACNWTGISKF
jgi:hypothetical protein